MAFTLKKIAGFLLATAALVLSAVVAVILVVKHDPSDKSVIARGMGPRGEIDAIATALKVYRINVGEFPSQEQGPAALVERPADLPPDRDWSQLMRSIPTDRWGNDYIYLRDDRFPGGFGIYSRGKDGISKTNGNDPDDIASWR